MSPLPSLLLCGRWLMIQHNEVSSQQQRRSYVTAPSEQNVPEHHHTLPLGTITIQCRAATDDYFHYRWIVLSIKCQKVVKNACYNVLKCLVLFSQQSKTKRYSLYYRVWQKKASNLYIWKAGTRERLPFLLKQLLKRFFDYQNSCCSINGTIN